MNLFNLTPETRIKMLKGVGIITAAACMTQGILLMRVERQIRELDRIKREDKIKYNIIRKYVDRADPAVSREIAEEFAFDWITKDL